MLIFLQKAISGLVGFAYAFLVDVLTGLALNAYRDFGPAMVTRAPVAVLLWIERVIFRHDKLSDLLGEHQVTLWPETLIWCLLFGFVVYLGYRTETVGRLHFILQITIMVVAHLGICIAALLISRFIWTT